MKNKIIVACLGLLLLTSCNKDKEIISSLQDYNTSMEVKGYHHGDAIALPKEVTDNAESVEISFGDTQTSDLKIDAKYFQLGNNEITFVIKTKGGKTLYQDATINVYAKAPEQNMSYEIVKTYPHDTNNFVEGFLLDGNTIYESDGQNGASQIIKYELGSTTPSAVTKQPQQIFSEGCAIAGDKVFQLTWHSKKGFVYEKANLQQVGDFDMPSEMKEGWGMTYDGKNLIASDGSNTLYFIDPANPSKIVRTIGVAGNSTVYDQLNELEYHDGYIYSNVWRTPYILKINPVNGAVVGKFDFSDLVKENTHGEDDVLNGIAFKGNNMLVTGKNWPTIYEVKIK